MAGEMHHLGVWGEISPSVGNGMAWHGHFERFLLQIQNPDF